MSQWPLLSLATFLPLVGAAFVLLTRGDNEEALARNTRYVALWTSFVVLVVVLLIWAAFDTTTAEFQFVERAPWIPAFGIEFHLGIDGISLFLIVLTAFLVPVCILCSWDSIRTRVREYMIAFLVMESFIIGVFCALDFVLFYLFFEAMLIPMFLIIGIWGGPRRIYSAFKFFLYTLVGSVLLLVAVLTMYFEAGTTSIPDLMIWGFDEDLQRWLWLAMFASFAVKVPMWPFHTWFARCPRRGADSGFRHPRWHPAEDGSVRVSQVFPADAAGGIGLSSRHWSISLSIVAIIYTSLVALMQEDMKKLIAYSSVAHMGFVDHRPLLHESAGELKAASSRCCPHGVVSAALFLVVGVVYDRMHSRLIASYGGLVHRMPRYALVFMVFMLASVGLPGTSGFVGEFLVLVGAFQAGTPG